MLIETLVIASCAQGIGCAQSTSAYYLYNKDLQEFARKVETIAEPLIKENNWIVYVIVPAYTIGTGKTASVPLTSNTALNFSVRNSYVGIEFNY